LLVSKSGLLTVAGGKWTTYRKMAQDAVDHAAMLAHLPARPCVTRRLRIHGAGPHAERHGELSVYGTDAPAVASLLGSSPALGRLVHPELPVRAGEVVWAARHEMARTLDDVMARRTRALILNARATLEAAPGVARLMAAELGRDDSWAERQVAIFTEIARGYILA